MRRAGGRGMGTRGHTRQEKTAGHMEQKKIKTFREKLILKKKEILEAYNKNKPYGKVEDFVIPKLYPTNHPYSWTVIGSMEDLNAAKLELLRSLTPEQVREARTKAEEWLHRNAPAEGTRTKPQLKPPRTSELDRRFAVGS